MKSLFETFLIMLIFCSFMSCNKCKECTCGSVTDLPYTEEVCRDNFDSNEDYNEAIATLEAVGCSCN
jgi:hypothetical protein